MSQENRENQAWRALRVQPSGRPLRGSLRAGRAEVRLRASATDKNTTDKQPFQTPKHNLIPTKIGPTYGVHLIARREMFEPIPTRERNRTQAHRDRSG